MPADRSAAVLRAMRSLLGYCDVWSPEHAVLELLYDQGFRDGVHHADLLDRLEHEPVGMFRPGQEATDSRDESLSNLGWNKVVSREIEDVPLPDHTPAKKKEN